MQELLKMSNVEKKMKCKGCNKGGLFSEKAAPDTTYEIKHL